MKKVILVFAVVTMFAYVALAEDGAGQAPCGPGKAGCFSAPHSQPPNLKQLALQSSADSTCTLYRQKKPPLPGYWEDSYGGEITVKANLVGTFKLPYCGNSHSFRIDQDGNEFTLTASWGNKETDCVGFTEYMAFADDCSTAEGLWVNHGENGASGTDTWVRDGISLKRENLMTISASGKPYGGFFEWNVVPVMAAYKDNPIKVTYPDNYNDMTNPNLVTLEDPVNATSSYAPGGLFKIYGAYTWQNLKSDYIKDPEYILVPTFGMTCYNCALESDWGDPTIPGSCKSTTITEKKRKVTYSGVYTPQEMKAQYQYDTTSSFCQAFIGKVKMEGAGRLDVTKKDEALQILAYEPANPKKKTKGYIYLRADIPTSDGTPAVANKTVAYDHDLIPNNGVKITLHQFGEVLANDKGSDIKGYHLDLYRGEGEAVCKDWNNPIVIGGCDTEQIVGKKKTVTCPSIF
jgi:3D (Asp-Asp-Asp) domain-containing protein